MIRFIIVLMAMALCACVSTASAQLPPDTLDIIDTGIVIDNGIDTGIDTETVNTVNAINTVDTIVDTTANTVKTQKDAINLDDEELLQAALAVDSAKIASSAQKLDLVRRDYEYKRQTRAAIVMMIFIAAAMATSQSWNPR